MWHLVTLMPMKGQGLSLYLKMGKHPFNNFFCNISVTIYSRVITRSQKVAFEKTLKWIHVCVCVCVMSVCLCNLYRNPVSLWIAPKLVWGGFDISWEGHEHVGFAVGPPRGMCQTFESGIRLYSMHWIFQGLFIDFFGTAGPISTKVGGWTDAPCLSTNLKNIWFNVSLFESDISVFAIGIHISELNCTNVGVRGLWHLGKVMTRLVLQSDHQEACARLWNPENRNPPI